MRTRINVYADRIDTRKLYGCASWTITDYSVLLLYIHFRPKSTASEAECSCPRHYNCCRVRTTNLRSIRSTVPIWIGRSMYHLATKRSEKN